MGKKTPTLPFRPEPLDALRSRWPAAMKHIFPADLVVTGKHVRPGQRRTWVFDFDDGYRLIVSREFLPSIGRYFHASMSMDLNSASRVEIARWNMVADHGQDEMQAEWLEQAVEVLNRVSHVRRGQPKSVRWTEDAVHFFYEDYDNVPELVESE